MYRCLHTQKNRFFFKNKLSNCLYSHLRTNITVYFKAYACVVMYVVSIYFLNFSRGDRLEMTASADTEESKLLSPRRNLEEEYLTYEAKVICIFE